jgi:glycerophosphoryl diester phosphodiesterase
MKPLKCVGAVAVTLSVFCATVWVVRKLTPLPPRPKRFEVIAHRGVFQNFSMEGVHSDTCTADRIYPPTHGYLENTIPSIEAAFHDGASMVELDIHPTTDNRLVVFHDWTLDCRTEGKGVTHEHTLAELKKLDVGYGYTADGGKTYPFRGKGMGLMPSLEEVLAAFPDKQLLINQKDNSRRTAALLGAQINSLPAGQRNRILFFGNAAPYEQLHQVSPEVVRLFPSSGEMMLCGRRLLLRVGFGSLPEACRLPSIALPAKYLWLVPGWPNAFLQKTAAANVPVYVIDLDTVEEAAKLANLPINGIMTNRIEIVGKALAR